MIKSLNEANKTVDELKQFYRSYIQQVRASVGDKKLTELVGCSEKYLWKVINTGSFKQAWKMANLIADTMSADKGTADRDSCT